MNEQDRQELERLSLRQHRLEHELQLLSVQINRLSSRLEAQPELAPEPEPNPPMDSVLQPADEWPEQQADEIPVPPRIPQSISSAEGEPVSAPLYSQVAEPEPVAFSEIAAPVEPTERPGVAPERSFELRLGTYWLVRVGIVMLLTGLVFFGNYTYQSFISKLGAGGKVGLMYAGSAILLAAGAWWQRKPFRSTMRNYGEVLFAGGLAAVYFTTYAAHHIPHLRIIQSAVLDGSLLVGWAALIVWIADRRKSEVLAMFAIGLAYYASIVTRAGEFTLWSNLVLAVGAVVFLVRNRWAGLSIGSLAATYGGYVFWRFFEASQWRFPQPGEALQLSAYFLVAYWIVFTAAVFLARSEKLTGLARASFLTANNAAFFSLFILTMLQVRSGGFWKISLGFGFVLLALAEVSRRVLASEPHAKNFYLTQGLLLVTIGLIAKFSGFNLALLLGAQSVVLLALGDHRNNRILRVGAWTSGLLATMGCFDALSDKEPGSIWFPAGLGAMFIGNTIMTHLRRPGLEGHWLRLSPAWFTSLALLVWLGAAWEHASQDQLPLVIVTMGLLLTLSIHVFKVREITILSQVYLVLGPLLWVALALRPFRPEPFLPWWNPAVITALVLGTMHWWQKQRVMDLSARDRWTVQGLYAALLVMILQVWVWKAAPSSAFMLWTSLVVVLATGYGAATRAWMLTAAAQLMSMVAVGAFVVQVADPARPHWAVAIAPMAAMALLAAGVRAWFNRNPDVETSAREPLLQTAIGYRAVAVAMSIGWAFAYVPVRELTWVFMAAGLAAFSWSGLRRDEPALWFCGVYASFSLAVFLLHNDTVYLPNLLSILALGMKEQVARRFGERYPVALNVRRTVAALVALALWVFVSRYVLRSASGFYLTASWSVVALLLFSTGILLRERAYRWFGLAVLACALGRVLVFDVWKLQTLYRVLSFMALGTVLIVLSFVYNKYQERIRQWL